MLLGGLLGEVEGSGVCERICHERRDRGGMGWVSGWREGRGDHACLQCCTVYGLWW
jgi:hypothetical protein